MPRRAAASTTRSGRPRRTTTRGELGAVTSAGRVLRFSPVDLPSVPADSVQLAAGRVLRDYLGITDEERARPRLRPLRRRDTDRPRHRAGRGQAHRARHAAAQAPTSRSSALKPGDEVVGAAPRRTTDELVFVTTDAQLLHFAASAVRPQGAPAGGMAGIKPVGAGGVGALLRRRDAATPTLVVVTISAPRACCPGTDPGRARSRAFEEFPAQGPRDRRRARARVPQGRRPSDARLGRPGACARGRAGRRGAHSFPRRRPSATRRVSRSTRVIGSIGGTLV